MGKFRKTTVLLIILCLLVAITACSTTDTQGSSRPDPKTDGATETSGEKDWTKENITLTVIHEHTAEVAQTVASSRMYLRVQDEFLETYPNINMEVTALGSSEVFERLTVLAASNELPDIVYLNKVVFDAVKKDNMLLDISEYFDRSYLP